MTNEIKKNLLTIKKNSSNKFNLLLDMAPFPGNLPRDKEHFMLHL